MPLGCPPQCVVVLLEFGAGEKYMDPNAKQHASTIGRPATAPAHMQGSAFARVVPTNNEVNSPLHWASMKGHLSIVWVLLNAGFSIHDVDSCGNSALHLAAAGGHKPVVTCLLSNGADLYGENYYGNAPLALASHSEMRTLLSRLFREPTYELDKAVWKPGSEGQGSGGSGQHTQQNAQQQQQQQLGLRKTTSAFVFLAQSY